MGHAQASNDGHKLFEQLKQIGEYSIKCKAGYGQLKGHLNSLYDELDAMVNNIPNEGRGAEYHNHHKKYKSSLEKIVNEQISKYDELGNLVAKVLGGSVTTESELDSMISKIDQDYKAVLQGSVDVYTSVNPSYDATKIVNEFYLHVADELENSKNVMSAFANCVGTLKLYFLPNNIDAILTKQTQNAEH